MESVRKKKGRLQWEGFAENESSKSEGVTDDESGELIVLMEKVPLNELGDGKLERLLRG